MGEPSLRDLNELRKPAHYKDPLEEDFLLKINKLLMPSEMLCYRDYPEEFPLVFVFGLPRSGTTLITQLMAHCLDVGYVNNLVARFWLAPLTGIRLSKILLRDNGQTDFQSRYATTDGLTDIHEFGYFWRYWLKKETISAIVNAREREEEIDWASLKRTLLNIQHEFGKAMVFKNMFGAYHIGRFVKLMAKALFIYIERDPLDTAISILDARKKFYHDLNTWWSSYPPEYGELESLPYMEQIGGQVYYLRRFYSDQIETVGSERVITISYRDVCANPIGVLERVGQHCRQVLGSELRVMNQPPAEFPYRQYSERVAEREQFQTILDEFDRQTCRQAISSES
jgi:hypothetical protein